MQSIRSKIFAAAVALPLGFAAAPAFAKDIVDTAAANPDFTILVKMINAAGLAETLKGPGTFHGLSPRRMRLLRSGPRRKSTCS